MPTITRAEAINRLTGQDTGLAKPADITPRGGGGKFTSHGEVLPFAGNTFVCHINQTSDAFSALTSLQAEIANGPFAAFFTYLPPASFHMTVFSGVHAGPPWQDGRPADLDPTAPLPQITQHFATKVPKSTAFATCRIVPDGLHLGHSLTVMGQTQQDRDAITNARETLQNLTQIYRPDFTTYRQHISLCYQVAWMTPNEALAHLEYADAIYARFVQRVQSLTLGPIEFCAFQDMHHFEPLALLASGD